MTPDRKEDILRAAEKCFNRFGYDKTTLDDIGEMSGMNKVSLYYYFKNKEAIFTEVINREADEFGESIKKKVEAAGGCREKIITWIKEGFKYNGRTSILNQLSTGTLIKLTPFLEDLMESSQKKGAEYFASILEDSLEHNEIIECDVNKVAVTIQNVIYSMKNEAYNRTKNSLNRALDFDGMVKDIIYAVSLILDGIIKK